MPQFSLLLAAGCDTAIFHFLDGLLLALRSMTLAAVAAVADDDNEGKDMSVGDEKQKD